MKKLLTFLFLLLFNFVILPLVCANTTAEVHSFERHSDHLFSWLKPSYFVSISPENLTNFHVMGLTEQQILQTAKQAYHHVYVLKWKWDAHHQMLISDWKGSKHTFEFQLTQKPLSSILLLTLYKIVPASGKTQSGKAQSGKAPSGKTKKHLIFSNYQVQLSNINGLGNLQKVHNLIRGFSQQVDWPFLFFVDTQVTYNHHFIVDQYHRQLANQSNPRLPCIHLGQLIDSHRYYFMIMNLKGFQFFQQYYWNSQN